MKKLRVGVLGATGMVGQRFISLLEKHPWFTVAAVAASERSAGKMYREAVQDRWTLPGTVPASIAALVVKNANDFREIAEEVDFVFSAVDMSKPLIHALEEQYARAETPVISNNSAHRETPDVPMMIPEINPEHAHVIRAQRKRLGFTRGFIAVKPNCSLQSYVPPLAVLQRFEPERVSVCTYQAVSGAGKTLGSWPEMEDNVIPFISGEEEKSEQEPLKILGAIQGDRIVLARSPRISAQCIRVPVSDGHLAAVAVSFKKKPRTEEILEVWKNFRSVPQILKLPLAPDPFFLYLDALDRPQTKLDRDAGNGMAITLGRLREDPLFDYKFVALSHNAVRGAAGGAILTAELLLSMNYLQSK